MVACISLLLMLVAFVFPVFCAAREKSWRVKCLGNLRQVFLGSGNVSFADGHVEIGDSKRLKNIDFTGGLNEDASDIVMY